VQKAEALLQGLVDRGQQLGAATLLLDEVRRRLRPPFTEVDVELLRLSVAAEPTWSDNHHRHRLGWALYTLGDRAGALREYDAAINNIIDRDITLDPVTTSFHDCFTGCNATREWLLADRDKLLAH
jgi:hypothetical protein